MLAGSGVSILAPGDVSPGHMMLAPLKMNRMAPLSTCTLGSRSGSGMVTNWSKYALSLSARTHIYVGVLVWVNKVHHVV